MGTTHIADSRVGVLHVVTQGEVYKDYLILPNIRWLIVCYGKCHADVQTSLTLGGS